MYEKLVLSLNSGYALHKMIYSNAEAENYIFLDVNPAFEKIIGMPREEIINKTAKNIIPQIEEIWIKKYDSALKTNRVKIFEGYSYSLSKYFRITAFKMYDDIFATIFDDITSLKKAQINLINAKGVTEKSDQLRSIFLTNISHRIRTPMNGIIGFSNVLKKSKNLKKEDILYLDIIESSGYALLKIINDILDLSKIESHEIKIKKEKIYLNDLLNELYTLFKSNPKVKSKKIVLKKDYALKRDASKIYTDPLRLNQILTNLITNAFEFTIDGSITIKYSLIENSFLQFIIEDTGIGIAQNKIDKIFDEFTRDDHFIIPSDFNSNTGLGLAIVKALIETLDGEIFVESKLNKGSKFIFTLPYINIDEADYFYRDVPKKEFNIEDKKTILVVEDNKISVELLKMVLKSIGNFDIIIANTGLEAIEKFKRNKEEIDLVLMDIHLPILNGFEVIKEIKKLKKDTPVIAQTANAIMENKLKAIQKGFDDFIIKPIQRDILIKKIYKFLK